MWRKFNALIPYYGGKRGLCPLIFKEIARVIPQKEWPKLTFADGFSGGGSVSLYAKGQGMKVLSNDIADRSRIIMDSLIANDRVMISDEDIHRLFMDCDHGHFVRDNFVPGMFMQKQAEFIDRALQVIARIKHHTKQQLLRLALIKYIVQITPFAYVHKVSYFEKLEFGDPDMIGEANRRKIPVTLAHPSRILKAIQKEINGAVFPSGHQNEAHQRDIFEFLENVNADICYLDPPYAGAADYKKYYGTLDQILAGRMFDVGDSEFNARDAERVMVKMLEVAKKFRLIVVSYGSHRFGVEGFEKLVKSVFPNAEIKQIKFRYSLMRETKEKSEMRELLAVIKN